MHHNGVVMAVSRSPTHTMAKQNQPSIQLLSGHGVEGDVHAGERIKHRYQVRRNPNQPNLCQVHLIHSELHEELRKLGFELSPGAMGENITMKGIELLELPTGARLHIGAAVVEITGLRTPCRQLDGIQRGLMAATRHHVESKVAYKAGIMGIVIISGEVKPGNSIRVELPLEPHMPLRLV